jgi:peptidoglycan/LPS O-acetylase OafA/YrhL
MAATITLPTSVGLARKEGHTRFYRPEIDALRFFAFFAVYGFHQLTFPAEFYTHIGVSTRAAAILSALPNAGVFGVDLFFVLSAYLITELLLREKDRFGVVNVRDFYLRRILRIWPLYFVFLAVAMLPFVNSNHSLTWKDLFCFLLLSGNWAVILFGFPVHSVIIPLWTVSIEEQFYLAWPPIVSRLSRRGVLIAAVGMIIISSVMRALIVTMNGGTYSIWCNTLTRLDPIAAGIILAVTLRGRTPSLGDASRLVLLVCGFSILVGVSFWDINQPTSLRMIPNLMGFPLVALACSLILLSVLGVRFSIPNPLIYLGKVSYGLYVMHKLGVFLADQVLRMPHGVEHAVLRFILSLAITMLLASVSYHFIESPFLRLKDRFTRVASRPV